MPAAPALHPCARPASAAAWRRLAGLLIAALLASPAWSQELVLSPGGVIGSPQGLAAAGQATTLLDGPLGRHAKVLDETRGTPLSLEQARERLAAGAFQPSDAEVPNVGNDAPPRWLVLAVHNPGATPLAYRLYVAEGWTDLVDAWLLPASGEPQHWAAGDQRSPSRDLRIGLGFAFDAQLPPGRSEIFVRADGVDSAALSLRLIPQERTAAIEGATQRWIGLVHGFLLALVSTYALLWLVLRDRNHLRYVAYVGAYLYMYFAYSGIGAQLAWPDSPHVARYAILVGMTLFSSAGLTFARSFLDLATIAPTVDRVVLWAVRLALAAMALCVITDFQLAAVHLAFAYITLLTFAIVALGLLGLRHRQPQAGMFLAATLLSMVGTLVTTLAVMGKLPMNVVIFRAIESGVMLEATIWALALGLRMRRQRDDGARALRLAQHDALTGLLNRRGFLDRALPAFDTAVRNTRPMAVVILDLDHFKPINDRHGHAGGDRVLVDVSQRLQKSCRAGDMLARWGGEEFVLLLPETGRDAARHFAERLREDMALTPVDVGKGQAVRVTASFGIALRTETASLDEVLQAADAALYRAKGEGRDRVVEATAVVTSVS